MVYSSDFYTSRRPAYYKPASSYSVTPLYSSDGYDLPPTYYKAHQVYQTCTTPASFILTPPLSTGKPSPNVLPYNGYPYFHHQYIPLPRRSAATIHGVLDRIEHRQRSHPSYDPTDEYLNSRSATTFDDVKRDIRAQTAGLLKQVYTPSFRPKMSSVSNAYSEMPIAQRIESDAYIEKILADSDSYRRENNIGKGHLACVSYAGGKAYPRRRPHLSTEVDDNITMLSYYNKTREAAAASSPRTSVKKNKTEKQWHKESEQDKSEAVEAVRLAAENEALKKEKARLAAEEEKAEALLIAEKEAARLAAEEDERRLALEKEAEEKSRLIAEKEKAAQLAAEEEKAQLAQKEAEEKARLLAEKEAARLVAEKEDARLAAEEEEHRLALEKEAEEIARSLAEKDAADKARLAAEEEEHQLALKKEADETARLLAIKKETENAEKPEQVDNEITTEEIVEVSAVSICELVESTQEIVDESIVKETNNDELDTEPEDVAQAEGQESTEEEDETEEDDE